MDHQTITAERGRRAADLRAAAVAALEQQSIASGLLLDLDDDTCVVAGPKAAILMLLNGAQSQAAAAPSMPKQWHERIEGEMNGDTTFAAMKGEIADLRAQLARQPAAQAAEQSAEKVAAPKLWEKRVNPTEYASRFDRDAAIKFAMGEEIKEWRAIAASRLAAPVSAVPAVQVATEQPNTAPQGYAIVPLNPTPAMSKAAVLYLNGPDIYSAGLAPTVLEIEESIYHEVYRAMIAAAPAVTPNCGACPGDGSICATHCKLANESPAAAPVSPPDVLSPTAQDGAMAEPVGEVKLGANGKLIDWFSNERDLYALPVGTKLYLAAHPAEGSALVARPEQDQAHVMPRMGGTGSRNYLDIETDDQWIFDLATKHESRIVGRLYGPLTFSASAIVDFVRDVESVLSSRFRAQGGNTQVQQTEPGQQEVLPERSDTPAPGELYTVQGKGGEYELIGTAKAAGTVRKLDDMRVYRATSGGRLYFRNCDDFDARMSRIDGDKQGAPAPKCPECKGSGYVMIGGGGEDRCSTCGGSGKQGAQGDACES